MSPNSCRGDIGEAKRKITPLRVGECSMVVDKFAINVEQAALKDLTRRLDATRWPDEIADSGWEFSTNLAYFTNLACLKSLVAYCRGRLRLAEARGGAQQTSTISARRRRPERSFRSCPRSRTGAPSTDYHAWLAWTFCREGTADGSISARRQRRGQFRCRCAIAPGIRLFRPATDGGVNPHSAPRYPMGAAHARAGISRFWCPR